uniref:Uncharacterized protein n=1 Tax=Haptolina brevifila TaxID=156173 RepID=A0A7S2HSJ3_9EUKA|mmetsp:Transcript_57320/g.113813  ORF Transcript_57320/g.113813 Transcript_57320/m.113813 type:complete len:112 (+) Transcript_57320:360-695(+)
MSILDALAPRYPVAHLKTKTHIMMRAAGEYIQYQVQIQRQGQLMEQLRNPEAHALSLKSKATAEALLADTAADTAADAAADSAVESVAQSRLSSDRQGAWRAMFAAPPSVV